MTATKYHTGASLGIWLALGAGIGSALGAATGDMGFWLSVGVGIGVAVGVATRGKRKPDDSTGAH